MCGTVLQLCLWICPCLFDPVTQWLLDLSWISPTSPLERSSWSHINVSFEGHFCLEEFCILGTLGFWWLHDYRFISHLFLPCLWPRGNGQDLGALLTLQDVPEFVLRPTKTIFFDLKRNESKVKWQIREERCRKLWNTLLIFNCSPLFNSFKSNSHM